MMEVASGDASPLSCIVCGSPGERTEAYRGYSLCRCSACGLQYSDPMRAGLGNYAEAYDQQSGPDEIVGEGLPFLAWTREASQGLAEFASFLTAAQQFALQLAKKRFQQGQNPAAVDIGFGAGWFLGALRASGFHPYGLEVADAPVELLREKGFVVAKSADGQFPLQWPTPALITAFEVLEHLEDPVEFLSRMCRQYPAADLMLSVPDEHRWFLLGGREAHDYPPNHMTRWSAMALNLGLRHAGYQHVHVWRVRPTAQELAMAKLRRFLPNFGGHPLGSGPGNVAPGTSLAEELRKRRQRRFLLSPVAVALRVAGKTACSMIAHASNRAPA